MKPLEAIFWLGTAGVLYMTANNIVKNIAIDVAKDIFKETGKRSDRSTLFYSSSRVPSYPERWFH
jgi:hypothetical protein